MTDLDSTEIITADESLTENSSTNDTKVSLIILSGTDPNTFQINKETIIGRSSPSDIIIPALSLSKQHAKITINNGQYFLTDLGSSNKTFQNKIQLQSNVCYALHDGDEIKFGDIICSFKEQKEIDTSTETKIDPNPSTQTISNSYDDQEPTQPMKVWNKNTNSTDVTPKQNGINESPNKSSSSFIPHSSSSTTNDDNDNDLIIGSTTLPATVPVVIEPKEVNNDDQIESVSSSQTNKNLSKEDSPPSVKELMITENSKLNDDDENITNNTAVKGPSSEEQMDTDQTTESPSMVIDEKQSENVNEMEEEVAPVNKSSAAMKQEAATLNVNKSLRGSDKKTDESAADAPEEEPESSALDAEEESALVSGRGVARKNVRRARGRRGAAARARVVSTRIHGGRRQPILPPTIANEGNNTTLEETVNTETEESPKKSNLTPEIKEKKSTVVPNKESSQTNTSSNVRISARIKERASSGRNRQFPYTDDYVDLDDIEKQSKTNTTTTPTTTTGRKSNRGRPSASPQKRISLRQQPIDASENSEQKDDANVYEQIDTVVENKEPTPKTAGRKRKSTTPIAAVTTKRNRPTTPQTVPTQSSRRKQTSTIEQSPTVAKPIRRTTGGQQEPATTVTVTTPKRGRKSTKIPTSTEQSPEKQSSTSDRPVRIALSSHLNFDQNHFDTLRKLGFEIMDESCQVDALVVDRIRRTKKFFMCLARGALILSPAWIDTIIKENRYIPYEKYYLEDTNAETRYGFQLRESVRLAKQGPIFENQKFFCTKDTSPPYDDLKDIIEAAGGKLLDKINMTKPGKDIICIVAQIHKTEFEDLFKKGLSIVSEEFILSGISKQKLDFDAFSLFQTVKPNPGK